MGTSYKTIWTPPQEVQYAVFQAECCPKTQRTHWQWMIVYPQRKRWSQVSQALSPDHVEICREPARSRNYCMKQETRIPGTQPTEVGQWSPEGSTLLNSIREKSMRELVDQNPWKIKQLKELKAFTIGRRNYMTAGILLTGEAGKGKSKIANKIGEFLGEDDTYWTEPTLTWFDNYVGEPLMIVDEMRGTKPEFALRLVDRYPLMLPYKGGFTNMAARMVIFTSNLTLEGMYQHLDDATMAALKRRIITLKVY